MVRASILYIFFSIFDVIRKVPSACWKTEQSSYPDFANLDKFKRNVLLKNWTFVGNTLILVKQ